MRYTTLLSSVAAAGLVVTVLPSPAPGQGTTKIPKISTRSFTSGSAKLTVTGSFQINADVPVNTKAAFGDGEMTWLQFGNSGSDAPNAMVTVSPDEIGITVGMGKKIATIGADACTGKMEVTATAVTGQYTCRGVTSHDPAVVKLGKVDIDIRFTAKS